MERKLDITSNEGAKDAGWEIIVPFPGILIGKAIYEDPETGEQIMKSTKRFRVPGGWMYNTTTEYHISGRVSVAEALAFAPDIGAR